MPASLPSADDLERHRAALTGHCYRMMGSAADADDAVQETLVRAWRALDNFEQRASLRTWLYRIATRVCLDALGDRSRRLRPLELEGPGTTADPLDELPRDRWVEPIPDDCPRLAALRVELLALPEVARCVDDARPYRKFFPYGAPDRD